MSLPYRQGQQNVEHANSFNFFSHLGYLFITCRVSRC